MQSAGGIPALWGGFQPLLLRELLFSLPKFVVFNSACSLLFAAIPKAQEDVSTSLVVSLFAGAIAGVAGAIISSPADLLLTKQGSQGSAEAESVGAAQEGEDSEESPFAGLFAGVVRGPSLLPKDRTS